MPDRTTTKAAPSTLVEGQRLDQPTFHALYEAMPPGTRAELIDGVVYMPSPVGLAHGDAQLPALVWLDYYAENTPGVRALPERHDDPRLEERATTRRVAPHPARVRRPDVG